MFDSGISLSNLVSELKQEVDIAIPIPNASYVLWANALEQLLYTELIQEQGKITIQNPSSPIELSSLSVPSGEAAIRFEDIHTVFADSVQLIKTTVTSGIIFLDTFYKTANKLGYNTQNMPNKVDIIYFVKPALKTTSSGGTIGAGNVMLPIEFVDLMKAKLRAEAYKAANEDEYAAKWVNDYNVLLETFKSWLEMKRSAFGM